MRIKVAVAVVSLLVGCGSTASTTFRSAGDELVAPSRSASPTIEPTPGTVICDAFDVVNDVISPAYSSLAEGIADEEQLASTIEAAAAAIDELAEDEPNGEVADQIVEMADRYRSSADTIRRDGAGGQDAIDYYLDLVVEHSELGTCD